LSVTILVSLVDIYIGI